MEEWKELRGFNGVYFISNEGRIKSISREVKNGRTGKRVNEENISIGTINSSGYIIVTLRKNNKGKVYSMHRLVAQEFIPNPKNKPFINHKDGIKTNNKVANLEWCTQLENVQHAIKIGLWKLEKPIKCLETNIEYKSIKECSEKMKLQRNGIWRVLTNRQKSFKGYTFKFIKE